MARLPQGAPLPSCAGFPEPRTPLRPNQRTAQRLMRSILLALLLGCAALVHAQKLTGPVLDYAFPKEYTIGGITVSGCVTRDANAVKLFSGLKVGDKIQVPGERIGRAIHAIW